jgi:hypothetical protein
VGACIVGLPFEIYDLAEDGGLELYNLEELSFDVGGGDLADAGVVCAVDAGGADLNDSGVVGAIESGGSTLGDLDAVNVVDDVGVP